MCLCAWQNVSCDPAARYHGYVASTGVRDGVVDALPRARHTHEVHGLIRVELIDGLAVHTAAPVDIVERCEDCDLAPVEVQRPGPAVSLGLFGELPGREGNHMVSAGSRLVGGGERAAERGVGAGAWAGICGVAFSSVPQNELQLSSEQQRHQAAFHRPAGRLSHRFDVGSYSGCTLLVGSYIITISLEYLLSNCPYIMRSRAYDKVTPLRECEISQIF